MRILLIIFGVAFFLSAQSQQQTVGLFENSEDAFDGYTLLTPMVSTNTYLIDNCGYVINKWESEYRPGLSSYLLEDGDMLRTGFLFSQFNSGGAGGRVERYSWDGELEWSYNYASDLFHQHHDIEPLPNGNLLLIAWERITQEETIALGRDSARAGDNGLWPDHIVELEPVGVDAANIVWEWHVKDHLVQDRDSLLPNYGEISEHPRRIDINRTGFGGAPTGADWNHCNGISYLPEHDLIALSSRNFNEVWVIDHSTTTEEAATSSGGRYNLGGDLLYRWGNPASYGRGTAANQQFFGQHDPSWHVYEDGRISLMVFNNGVARPEGRYSSVDEIILPELTDTGFVIFPDEAFGPEGLHRSIDGGSNFEFFSPSISGAQRQPNGNILICVGGTGRLIEVDEAQSIHWDYVNPDAGSPITQGQSRGANNVFKVFRYPPDYAAFDDLELVPGERIELEPLEGDCELFPADTTTSAVFLLDRNQFDLITNPAIDEVRIQSTSAETFDVTMYTINGVEVAGSRLNQGLNALNVAHLAPGVYVLTISDANGHFSEPFRVIVL